MPVVHGQIDVPALAVEAPGREIAERLVAAVQELRPVDNVERTLVLEAVLLHVPVPDVLIIAVVIPHPLAEPDVAEGVVAAVRIAEHYGEALAVEAEPVPVAQVRAREHDGVGVRVEAVPAAVYPALERAVGVEALYGRSLAVYIGARGRDGHAARLAAREGDGRLRHFGGGRLEIGLGRGVFARLALPIRLRLRRALGIHRAAGYHGGGQDDREDAHIPAGGPGLGHGLYAPLHVVAEGQGGPGAVPAARGEVQERLGVIRPRASAEPPERGLVAARLHVPHREHPREPHERVEPVQAQRYVGEQLVNMVAAPYVAALVREDALPLALRELRGQVYARAEQAHGEGGLYVIAEEDAPGEPPRIPEPHAQAEILHQPREQENPGDCEPYERRELHGVGYERAARHRGMGRRARRNRRRRGRRLRRGRGAKVHEHRRGDIVHHRHRPGRHDGARRGLRHVEERDGRAHGEWAQQPEERRGPERV